MTPYINFLINKYSKNYIILISILEKRKKEEELRHKEILFKIERYAISLFALFFLVFNAVYWVDLLYSAKFSER